MIPPWNLSGVLPPFVGSATGAASSPYWTTTDELASRFAQSPARRMMLQGLLMYRRALVGVGIRDAFQWIDGSFIEDVERTQNRRPGDIDLVTFGHLPVDPADTAAVHAFAAAHPDLLDQQQTKRKFSCDAYFVNLALPPKSLVERAKYWSNLFSHRRSTHLWKGIVAVDLAADDSAAWALIT
jgi:hypothetical protein